MCNACSYSDGTINSYCAAVFKYFNSVVQSTMYVSLTETFWCRADVIESIESGVGTFIEKYGEHVPWWESSVVLEAANMPRFV